MKDTTKVAISAILESDDTINAKDANEIMSILNGRRHELNECGEVMLSRLEAADLLRVSPMTVTRWADEGLIRRVRLEGRRKSQGYSRNSIVALIEGRSA